MGTLVHSVWLVDDEEDLMLMQTAIKRVTPAVNPSDRQQSAALGANEYDTKPDNFDTLTRLVSQLMHQWLPMAMV